MTKQKERRIPNFLGAREEQHMKIKHLTNLTDYQIAVYERELRKERKALAELESKTEMRKEAFGCLYDSREKLDQAYLIGALDEMGYMKQRSALWQTYSDRGHGDRIEWLERELERYKLRRQKIEDYKVELSRRNKERSRERWKRKQHRNAMDRARRRRERSERKRKQQEELRKKWMYYGNK